MVSIDHHFVAVVKVMDALVAGYKEGACSSKVRGREDKHRAAV
jgi:hypothetical protein